MADQKISQLTSIGTVDNAADLFPIVDTSASETKKITPSALKTALALNNVDNTSDANKPISSATQTALNAKQDSLGFAAENVANKSTSVTTDQASNTKYPSVKAVYDWAVATFQAAIGYTPANKAGETFTGPISATNLSGTNTGDNAVNSLYSGLAASKQDTLVSGTNIKTVNSTSLLGSGDIVIGGGSPSGVSGAIQFSNGSAFASDAANFFWDDTNNRLGVGTNSPSAAGHFKGSGSTSATTSLLVQNSAAAKSLEVTDDQQIKGYSGSQVRFKLGYTNAGQSISTRDGEVGIGYIDANNSSGLRIFANASGSTFIDGWTDGTLKATNYPLFIGSRGNNNGPNVLGITTQENGTQTVFGYAVNEASSLVTINSTTRGFLPPRMTNTQRLAISSPAVGLEVYCTDTVEGKYIYKSTGWTFVI